MNEQSKEKKILLLLSGGPDSSTLAKMAERERKETGGTINAIYLRTGHAADAQEIESANKVMARVGGKLEIIDVSDMVAALGGKTLMVHSEAAILPFGNAIVLSLAIAYALQFKADSVLVGLHKDDADENEEYTRWFIDQIVNLATSVHGRIPSIRTPFIEMTKSEVFRLGAELDVDYSVTWSCIRSGTIHCGQCGACRARRRAFVEAGADDPTEYDMEPIALDSVSHEPMKVGV